MSKLLSLREKAKTIEKQRVVLTEGEDARVVRGAAFLAEQGIAEVLLLGEIGLAEKLAGEEKVSLEKVRVIDPRTYERRDEIIDSYYQKRKSRGITPEESEKFLMDNYVFFGAMMTRLGIADGFVSGACHKTSDVARSAIQCLSIDKEIGTVSSAFIMEMENCPFGENGLFAYGDCGIIPYPTARQLTGIAIATSDLFKDTFDIEPRVALLSFSTKGSAKGDSIDTIHAALSKVKEKRPEMLIDGELQLDAAIVPEVAELKCAGSEVAGKANVLIFPNLDAGNISYKLSQRLANARAVGPIMLGLDKPCSDLSRGCSWEDVVDTATITAMRSGAKKNQPEESEG